MVLFPFSLPHTSFLWMPFELWVQKQCTLQLATWCAKWQCTPKFLNCIILIKILNENLMNYISCCHVFWPLNTNWIEDYIVTLHIELPIATFIIIAPCAPSQKWELQHVNRGLLKQELLCPMLGVGAVDS